MPPVNLGCVIPSTYGDITLGARLERKNVPACSKYIHTVYLGRFWSFFAYVCLDSGKTTQVMTILRTLFYFNFVQIMLHNDMREIKEHFGGAPPLPPETTYVNIYSIYIYIYILYILTYVVSGGRGGAPPKCSLISLISLCSIIWTKLK